MPQLGQQDALKRRYSPAARNNVLLPKEKRERWLRLPASERTSAVWKLLRPSAKDVYSCLRTYGIPQGDGTRRWYMSYAEMAEETGYHRRTVRRAIASLVVIGLLSRDVRKEQLAEHHRGPGWVATLYTIHPVASVNAEQILEELAARRAARAVDVDELDEYGEAAPSDELDQAAHELREAKLQADRDLRLEASARAFRGVLEHERQAVAAALGELAGLQRIPAPSAAFARDPANIQATRAADTARGRRTDAGQGLDLAERQLEGLLQVLDGEAPPKSWAATLAAIQLALNQATAAQRLYQEAVAAHNLARDVYLVRLQPALQGRLPLKRPPPKEGAAWYAPDGWEPLVGGRTESSWRRQRETWRIAKAQGVQAVLERLVAQGFDPAWPDPPPPPPKAATGPP